jgi:hypothetical protein
VAACGGSTNKGFVQWVIEENPRGLRQIAISALDAVVRRELAAAERRSNPGQGNATLRAHGVLNGATRAAIRSSVLLDVVAPSARALTDEGRKRSRDDTASPTLEALS